MVRVHAYHVGVSRVLVHNTCKTAAKAEEKAAAKAGSEAGKDVEDVLKVLPEGRSQSVRTVGSDQELDDLYKTLSGGGAPVEVPGYAGSWVELANGTRVGIRDSSKSGGRTIDIKMPDGSQRKVHINE